MYHSLLRPRTRTEVEEARDVKVRTLMVSSITVIIIILIGSSHNTSEKARV